jgi:hypothetical protein
MSSHFQFPIRVKFSDAYSFNLNGKNNYVIIHDHTRIFYLSEILIPFSLYIELDIFLSKHTSRI